MDSSSRLAVSQQLQRSGPGDRSTPRPSFPADQRVANGLVEAMQPIHAQRDARNEATAVNRMRRKAKRRRLQRSSAAPPALPGTRRPCVGAQRARGCVGVRSTRAARGDGWAEGTDHTHAQRDGLTEATRTWMCARTGDAARWPGCPRRTAPAGRQHEGPLCEATCRRGACPAPALGDDAVSHAPCRRGGLHNVPCVEGRQRTQGVGHPGHAMSGHGWPQRDAGSGVMPLLLLLVLRLTRRRLEAASAATQFSRAARDAHSRSRSRNSFAAGCVAACTACSRAIDTCV